MGKEAMLVAVYDKLGSIVWQEYSKDLFNWVNESKTTLTTIQFELEGSIRRVVTRRYQKSQTFSTKANEWFFKKFLQCIVQS